MIPSEYATSEPAAEPRPGPDADAVATGERDEVPDDQEVVGEPHLLDRLQLEAQALGELGRDRFVALLQAFFAKLDEIVERLAAVRHREVRQQDPAQLDLDVAPLGHLERAAQGVLVAGEVERHLLGRLEVEVLGVELPVIRVLQRVAGLDAQQRLVGARVGVAEVVHVAGRDGGQADLAGELGELREDPLLHVEVRVLQLDVDVVAAEDLPEPVELRVRVGGAVLLERLADAAREAAREGDQTLAVGLQQLPVDPRLVVVALEVAERRELDQVRVADVVAGEQRQVRIALLLGAPVVGDVHLAADDRLDAGSLRGLPELNGARHRAVIGERDRRHVEVAGLLDQVRECDTPRPESSTRSGRGDERRARRACEGASVRPGPDGPQKGRASADLSARDNPVETPLSKSTGVPGHAPQSPSCRARAASASRTRTSA